MGAGENMFVYSYIVSIYQYTHIAMKVYVTLYLAKGSIGTETADNRGLARR